MRASMPHMGLELTDVPVVWSATALLHHPRAEIWLGVELAGTEVKERATVIRDAVAGAGARLVEAVPHDDTTLRDVHDERLLEFLEHGYEEWVSQGFLEEPGQDRIVPYVFPTAGMLQGMPLREAAAIHGRAGRYGYDTMTLVGPGTWDAARGAVDVALTAADVVVGGERLAYGICRPPGHHVTREAYGGSCYLNNAGVAAQRLRETGSERVAVIDIDAHHGNGTQMLFYDRDDVFYGSLHVDPGAGWFPHYLGYAEERGAAAGTGTTRNVPLTPGTADADWLAALDSILTEVADFDPGAVVVSLGVDAAADDPESPLQVTHDGYRRAGQLIGGLGVPVVAVQEGGYHLPTLGSLVVATLDGLASATQRQVQPPV
jgi:acetoin utilization deacetylase AcuC-like enzyme